MSAKIATPGFLKIELFWNKDYEVTISVEVISNKILSSYWDYIVDAVLWPKFGNSLVSDHCSRLSAFLKEFKLKQKVEAKIFSLFDLLSPHENYVSYRI